MKSLRKLTSSIIIVLVLWVAFLVFIFDKGLNDESDFADSRLTRIIDGDTIVVTIPDWPYVVGNDIPVRIANIDAPERACVNEWNRSREYLVELLGDSKTVELRNIQRGKYFRLIAEVWADGGLLGERMISDGYAVEYGSDKIWC